MSEEVLKSIKEEYLPTVIKMDIKDKKIENIFDYNANPQFSTSISYPKFSYGFQHYIHQTKDKMEFTEEFKNKKKVYLVLNKFERHVDDYNDDIDNKSKLYFELGSGQNILGRAFFKLWELLFMFDLVQLDKANFVSVHIDDGPGSFVQSTMFFRDKYSKKGLSKDDKYHIVSVNQSHVKQMNDVFVSHYSKEKPQRIINNKNDKNIKADFITADGGSDWKNVNVQEQDAFKFILAQIVAALSVQKNGGNFVCKIYESFAVITAKLIAILQNFYSDITVVKPLTSRLSSSEKYIICMNFKDNKDNGKKIGILSDILDKITNKHVADIFPEFEIPEDTKKILVKLNTKLANQQFITINEMKTFVDKQNYRGDEYDKRRNMQIDASDYWTNMFLPDPKSFDSKVKHVRSLIGAIVDKNR